MVQPASATAMPYRTTSAGGKAKRFPWWLLPLAAPFNTVMRELLEMRYLWRTPMRMTNARLVAELGSEPHTPIDDAVRATLRAMGCLSAETEDKSELAGAAPHSV